MSPVTDSRNSRPVCFSSRSYRCGTMETSRPGSIRRAAASDSSSARLAGCFPGACDSTTVSLVRLMAASGSVGHLAFEDALRVRPAGVQELVVLLDAQGGRGVAGH